MELAQRQPVAPPSRCGLTELFRETGINSPHPGKCVDTSCAKTLNFSQNTVGGFYAESQELGYAMLQTACKVAKCAGQVCCGCLITLEHHLPSISS